MEIIENYYVKTIKGNLENWDKGQVAYAIIGINENDVYKQIEENELDGLGDFAIENEIEENFNQILISVSLRAKIISDFLKNYRVEDYIYDELKKDKLFYKNFENIFIKTFHKLRGKRNNDFELGKIPNSEIEFLKSISVVINNRLAVLNKNTKKNDYEKDICQPCKIKGGEITFKKYYQN